MKNYYETSDKINIDLNRELVIVEKRSGGNNKYFASDFHSVPHLTARTQAQFSRSG